MSDIVEKMVDGVSVFINLKKTGGYGKFVHLKDEQGSEYLVSLSLQEYEYHEDIVKFAQEKYEKEFKVIGGGEIAIQITPKIFVNGRSSRYGRTDNEYIGKIVGKLYPDFKIVAWNS
ncbi:hypothetical protein CSB11_02605 [Candidatus Campbellbacteria bacterium]|nr:MAG: hypothetical protein CSB11_02605 [Candidatus Campbellbacteria bacterium]